MHCLVLHICVAGRSACLPEAVTFEKAGFLICTDQQRPGFFLSLNDFDAIEAVSCNACVEDSSSKILQCVFFSFGLHVPSLDPSTEKKIFIDCPCLFSTTKASSLYTIVLKNFALKFSKIGTLSSVINKGTLACDDQ